MSSLAADLRHAVRGLRSRFTFTLTAVLTLALGIGVTTTMYGIVAGILLKPLPFPRSDRLITICEQYPGATADWCSISPPNVEDVAKRSKAIMTIGIGRSWPYHLITADGPEAVTGGIVTPELFEALGVRPILGRLFDRSDVLGRESVVTILSYDTWQTRFGGVKDILGRRIVLDGKPVTVVGVLPSDFQLPPFSRIMLWRTIDFDPAAEQHREWRGFVSYGLLREGTSIASARAELTGIADQLRREHFAKTRQWGLQMESLQDLVVGGVRPALLLFLGAVGLILLIACANVANLLLAQAGARARELALRSAVGASRSRLVQGLLVESLLLALMGGTLGVLVAKWGTMAFKALAPVDIPRLGDVQIDERVLVFALALSIATTVLFGLGPALLAVRADLAKTLREGGRGLIPGSARSARLLVVMELALALLLLSAAGLLARSFAARAAWNPGFERDHLITFSVFAPADRFKGPDVVASLLDRIERELGTVPGVERAGSASGGPLFGGDGTDDVHYSVSAGPVRSPAAWYDMGPSYFATLGVPIVAGRGLSSADTRQSPITAVVNETLAKKFWPADSPLDKEISMFSDRMKVRIVGVVRDMPPSTPGAPVQPEIYWSNRQVPRSYTFFILRTSVDPASVMPAVRARLRSIDTSLRPMRVATMADLVVADLHTPRFQMLLLGTFSLAALALAAVGTYGLFAYRVSLRAREIGIRIALGAQRRHVMGGLLADGLVLALAGTLIGVVASLSLGHVMSRIAVGVPGSDPLGLAASCCVMLAVTIVACYAPARRAASVDPAVTLTAE